MALGYPALADERRIRIGYDGSRYDRPELKWTQSSFIQPQMMVQDRYFYDPVAGKYTVDRYLDDLEKRYGGIDAVLIWPTYPNMGIDNRNQHDMIRSMPGGVAGVRQMIADFHHRGVRVLFPMMMWDQGTRDPGKAVAGGDRRLMAEIGADGINGDTQDGVPLAFSLAADKIGHPLAFEPEGGPSDEALAWNVMTWGQYQFPFIPQVDKYKWLEPRHMVNISDRWNRDKTDDLQFAFFNGVGWESWENIWGIWNGITPRDAEATRRVATIERAMAPFLVSKDWEPLAPNAALWRFREPVAVGRTNAVDDRQPERIRRGRAVRWKSVRAQACTISICTTDRRSPSEAEGKIEMFSFAIEAHGFGAILATKAQPNADRCEQLMAKMKTMTSKPLSGYSHEWEAASAADCSIQATKPAANTLRRDGENTRGRLRVRGCWHRDRRVWTRSDLMCSIHGKIHPGGFTRTPCTCIRFTSTSIR